MSWLTLNGIEVAGIAAIDSAPTGEHRDIGAQHEAADGSLVTTRQVRKRDLTFGTVPLSGADAFAWESFLTGEGHYWSFDVSAYSSKGFPPTLFDGTLESATPSPKYGAKYVQLDTDEQFVAALGATSPYATQWSTAFWLRNDAVGDSAWHHYVVTYPGFGSGNFWKDGVGPDVANYTEIVTRVGWAIVGGQMSFTGYDPGPSYIDDLVFCPYVWPDDWAVQLFNAGRAFGPLPYLIAAGDLVPEASTRSMICTKCDERVMKANLSDGEGMAADVRVLSVELKAR